jgi:tetratricopeptide (TPR) repeat protein
MKNAWRSPCLGATLIVLLTVAAYLPAFRCGFVMDDELLITENRIIKAGDGLCRFWFTTESPDYYPLTWSLWWLEWRLWGSNAAGYHVVNVLLHAANAVLVWMILRRLKIPGAWLAGLVFAVHPVNVATVAWISEQKNTLSMLFFAVAILLYLRFDAECRLPRTSVRGWRWYGLSLAAFLLALLSKTAAVMFPVVLLGCVWWTRGTVRWKDLLRSGPFFVMSLVLGLVTIWFQYDRVLKGQAVRTGGFLSRLVAAGWVPWFYLDKVFLPFNLTVIYPKWDIDATQWISYIPGMILVGCFALFWWKRRTGGRPLLFALGYFVATLFPVLGFFDQAFYQFSLVADHWQYYSIVGVIALVVAAGERICRRMGEPGRYLGTVAGVAVLAVLAVATWRRNCVYADPEILWRDNVAKEPNVWAAHNNLGGALLRAGKVEESIRQFELALHIKPDLAVPHNNLGRAFLHLGNVEEAVHQFELALHIKPEYAEAHNNLGVTLGQIGDIDGAIRHLEQAVRIKPDFAEAHYDLAVALELAGRMPEAIRHLEQAVRLKPDFVEAQSQLARLRSAQ